jgi:hypothetical protein
MGDLKHSVAGPRARANSGEPERGLAARQFLTVALLFGGYAACYFCRADLSVAAPLLIDELGRRGVSHADALVPLVREVLVLVGCTFATI